LWPAPKCSFLSNKSKVRLEYRGFQVKLRYLLAGDPVEDGNEGISHRLRFPRTIDDRIPDEKRFFTNSIFINPKQEFRHRYITHRPSDATFA
jgi:hypothetical protein